MTIQNLMTSNCAAAQAHRHLVRFGGRMLRHAQFDLRSGSPAAAQTRIECATRLLDLTSLLHGALQARTGPYGAREPAEWVQWTADLRYAAHHALWPSRLERFETRAKLLLERMLVVRWGDAGAMFVQPLPRLAASGTVASPSFAPSRASAEEVAHGHV